MLEFIRRHQKWVLFLIIIVVLPSFIFFGVGDYQSFLSNEVNLVHVKKQKISQAQFNEGWRARLDQMRQQSGDQFNIAQADTPANRQAFLDQLINNLVLQQLVQDKHLTATDRMVQEAIASDPTFATDNRFDLKKYTSILQSSGVKAEDYQERVRYNLAMNQVSGPVAQSFTLPAKVIADLEQNTLQERTVRLKLFQASDYEKQVKVSDNEIQAWYDKNKANLTVPHHVDADYIVLNQEAAVKSVPTPNDDELKKYYDSNAKRFIKPETRQVNHIQLTLPANATEKDKATVLAKAKDIAQKAQAKPDTFAQLAKQYSDDAGTKNLGGSLGVLSKGELPSLDGVFKEADTGVYAPMLIGNAYHIFQVTHISPAQQQSFDEVKPKLINEIKLQLASEKFADLATSLTQLANDDLPSLAPISEELQLPIAHMKGVTQAGLLPEDAQQANAKIFENPRVREALFSQRLLKEGHNSGVIEISPSELVVVHVAKNIPQAIPALDQVKDTVKTFVQTQKALAIAKEQAQKQEKVLQTGKGSLDGFQDAIKVSRVQPGQLPIALSDHILAAPVDHLPTYATVELPMGYVLARIEAVQNPDEATLAAVGYGVQNLFTVASQNELEHQVLNQLRQELKVEITPDAKKVINDVQTDDE